MADIFSVGDPESIETAVKPVGKPEKIGYGQDDLIGIASSAAKKYGADIPDFEPVFLALGKQESQFNHEAKSPTGVKGLYQVTLNTGRMYKSDLTDAERSDPYISSDIGAQHLAALYKEKGNLADAVFAYNGGSDPNFKRNVGRHLPWARGRVQKSNQIVPVGEPEPIPDMTEALMGDEAPQIAPMPQVGATLPVTQGQPGTIPGSATSLDGTVIPEFTPAPSNIPGKEAPVNAVRAVADLLAQGFGYGAGGAPNVEFAHGRTEPVAPEETAAAERVGTELARGTYQGASLGLIQPPTIQPETGPTTGRSADGSPYTIPGRLGNEAKAAQIIRKAGEFAGMALPLSRLTNVGVGVADLMVPGGLGTAFNKILGSALGFGAYGGAAGIGETIGQGEKFDTAQVDRIINRSIDDTLLGAYLAMGAEGVTAGLQRLLRGKPGPLEVRPDLNPETIEDAITLYRTMQADGTLTEGIIIGNPLMRLAVKLDRIFGNKPAKEIEGILREKWFARQAEKARADRGAATGETRTGEPGTKPPPEEPPAAGMAASESPPAPRPAPRPDNSFQNYIMQVPERHQADPQMLAQDFLNEKGPQWIFSPAGMKETAFDSKEVNHLQNQVGLLYASLHPEAGLRPDEVWQHLTDKDMAALQKVPRAQKLMERLETAVTLRMGEAQKEIGERQSIQDEKDAIAAQIAEQKAAEAAQKAAIKQAEQEAKTKEKEAQKAAKKPKGKLRRVKAKKPPTPTLPPKGIVQPGAAGEGTPLQPGSQPALEPGKPGPERALEPPISGKPTPQAPAATVEAKGKEAAFQKFSQKPLTRVVGEDFSDTFLHGTKIKNISSLTSLDRPVTSKKVGSKNDLLNRLFPPEVNEFGAEMLLSEPRQGHQAVDFASGPGEGMAVIKIKPGTKILDLSDEATRTGTAQGFLKFFKKPAINNEFTDWYLKQVSEGYKERHPDWQKKITDQMDPTSTHFFVEQWKDNLVKFVKSKGYGLIRFADETLVLDRSVIRSSKLASKEEFEKAKTSRQFIPESKTSTLFYDQPTGAYKEAWEAKYAPAATPEKPEGGAKGEGLPPGVAEFQQKFGTARGEPPQGLMTRKKPVYDETKAEENYDRETIIKAYGKFNSQANVLKNFTPEERRRLFPFTRRGAQGPDSLLQELKGSNLGYMFSEFETDADLLRSILDGELKPKYYDQLEEHYAGQISAQAESEGIDPASLAKTEADVEGEISRERRAIEDAGKAATLAGERIRREAFEDRLAEFNKKYPDADRNKTTTVLETFPNATNEQILRYVTDPKAFEQLRQQRVKKMSEAGGDADQMQALPGMGGLLEPPQYSVQGGETKKPVLDESGAEGFSPKFLLSTGKGGINGKSQEGFKTADDFLEGQKRNPGSAQVRAGLKQILEDYKSWQSQEVVRTGGDNLWESVNFSEALADNKDFQGLQKKASDHRGILIPIKNLDVPGIHIPGVGGNPAIIMVNENSYDYTYKQIVDHEVFHGRLDKGDTHAKKLIEAIDRDSKVFKDFSENVNSITDVMGKPVLSTDDIAEELAANYAAGISLDMPDGEIVSLSHAFKEPSKALGLKLKYNSTLPPKASPIKQKAKELLPKRPPGTPKLRRVQPETTGTKRAFVDLERELRGWTPIEIDILKSENINADAVRKVNEGFNVQELANGIVKNPRGAISPEDDAMLKYDRMRLQKSHAKLMDAIDEARKSGGNEAVLRQELSRVEDAISTNDMADRIASAQWHSLGMMKQYLISQDFSLDRLIQQARMYSPDGKVSEELRQKLEDMSKELQEANKKLEAYEKDKTEKKAKQSVKDIDIRINRAIKSGEAKKQTKSEAMVRIRSLAEQFRDSLHQLNMLIAPNQVKFLAEIAKELIKAGITDAKEVINTIFDEVSQLVPEITLRDVEVALSGYGKVSKPSQEEVKKALAEIRKQVQLFLKLEDALAGQMPLRSGFQPGPPSDEVRALIREVKQAMRDSGIDSTSSRTPEEQLKTSLDTAKTRLNNQIRDNKKRLADLRAGRPVLKKKGSLTYDKEANDLKTENDLLLKAIREIEGKPGLSDEQRIKIATDAVKKSMVEYTRRIKEKDLSPGKKSSLTPETPELKKLRGARDVLVARYRQMLKVARPSTDPDVIKVRNAIKTAQKSITEYERRIKNKDLSPRPKVSTTPETPELKAIRARRDALAKMYKQMQRDARPTIDPEVAANRRYHSYLLRRDAQLQGMLDTGNFEKSAKRIFNLDSENSRLKANVERKKQEIEKILYFRKMMARSRLSKTLGWGFKLRRAVILSGMGTMGKLAAAATMRQITTPLEDFVGAGLRMLPYLRPVFNMAPTEGGGINVRAEAAGFVQWFKKQTYQDVVSALKLKPTELDLLYGKDKHHLPPTMLDWFGYLHKAMKTPIQRVIFYRTLQRRTEWAMNHGVDMTEPVNQMAVGSAAYLESQRAIFMNNNFASDLWFKKVIKPLLNSKDDSLNSIGFLLQVLNPIVKVPTNFTGEIISYTFGVPMATKRYFNKGGSKGVKLLEEHVRNNPKNAFTIPKGFEGFSFDDTDYYARNMKKGGLGLMVFLFGMAAAVDIGGYFISGEKRKGTDVRPGDIRVGGINISHLFLHHPVIYGPLMLGATMMRVIQNYKEYNQKHPPDMSKGSGVWGGVTTGARGVALGIPFFDAPGRIYEAMKYPGSSEKYIYQFAESLITPPDIRRIAKAMDKAGKEQIPREQQTLGQTLQGSIPGQRSKLPFDVNKMKRMTLDRIVEIIDKSPPGTFQGSNFADATHVFFTKFKSEWKNLTPEERVKYREVSQRYTAMIKEQRENQTFVPPSPSPQKRAKMWKSQHPYNYLDKSRARGE